MEAPSQKAIPLRPPNQPRTAVGYVIALLSVALATLIRWPLYPLLGTHAPFITYFPAIVLTAWYAGWRPSLLATFLGLVASAYWLVLPEPTFPLPSVALALSLYTVVGWLLAVFINALRTAGEEAERSSEDIKSVRDQVFALNTQLSSELAAVVRLHEVGGGLMQEDDLSTLLGRLNEAAIEITGADMGNVQLLDAVTGELHIEAQKGFEQRFVDFFDRVDGQADWATALRHGGRLIVEDVANDPVFQDTPAREEMLAAGALAVVSIPLLSRSSQPLGIFSTHYRRRHRPSERDLRLLDLLSRQAAEWVERTRVQFALRESERRHRNLMELMPAAVYTCSIDGRIQYFNRRAAELWGREPAIGDLDERFCGSFRLFRADGSLLPHHQAPMAEVLAGGAAVRDQEVTIERPDGSQVVVTVNIDPLTNPSGRRIGAINVFQDVTERKRHEEQQALLAAIVESSDDAIVSKTLDGTVLSWNRGAERLLGFTAEEMIGQSILKIIPPERHDEERSILRHISEGEHIAHFETLRVAKDGSRLDISLAVSPVRNQGGAVVAASKVGRDITARKRAEETLQQNRSALAEQNQRLQLLGEAAAHVLVSNDPDGLVRGLFEKVKERLGVDSYFNFMVNESRSALRLASYAGVPRDAAASLEPIEFGQEVCGVVAKQRQPIVLSGIQQSADPNVDVVRSLGIRAYVCFPLLMGGRLLGTLAFGSRSKDAFEDSELEVLRTLCHYLSAAYERVRLIHQLQEADRLKDEFLAMLGHELRNPLAAISTGMALLESDPPRDRRDWIESMVTRQTNQLRRLVDDLLDVSRITRGKIELHWEVVEIAGIVEEALETVRPLVESRKHKISIERPSAPIYVNADPVRLAQVFSNLVNNAAKYTDDGGQIWLAIRQQDREVVLSVRDDGAGISAALLPRVFERFAQSDKSSGRDQSGLGIGLTLAQKMVEMHGGSIEARSEGEGQGSEFVVRLPICVEPEDGEADSESDGKDPVRSARWRILVVDDNEDAASAMGILLEQLGHDVAVVHDGPAALERVREHRPQVVLLDIAMPGMDGYEVARRLRREPSSSHAFVVAVTGYGQAGHQRRSREAGFDEHLVKPVNLDSLQTLLASAEGRIASAGVAAPPPVTP